ncbi:MAG: hypothetical protein AB8F78_05425 [Saprospiraceae bacterium]
MLTYEQLPDNARLWIYPSSTELNDEQCVTIAKSLEAFAEQWTSHSRSLSAYAGVWSNRFLVFGLNEDVSSASGCSIDGQVRFVKQLGEQFQADFFDRMHFFATQDQVTFKGYSAPEFGEAYASGELTGDTMVVDPLVTSKAAARSGFLKPLKDSWHSRFV